MVMASFFDSRKFNFDYSYCMAMDCVGRSRRLAMLCMKEVDFEILCFSLYHTWPNLG